MNFYRVQTISKNIALPFLLITVLLLGTTLLNYDEKNQAMNLEMTKKTITKYAIQCYASEGSYPPDLEYLEENYGLILDHDKYIYYYDAFASNVLPIIDIQMNMSGKDDQ